jgi:hypothetical protein
MYDGTDDISIGTVNSTTNAFNASNAASTSSTIAMTAAINEASATVASASTTGIGAAAGNYVSVTGTTTITSLGTIQTGTRRVVRFAGALTLTHNATSLILPGGANIVTEAGDVGVFVSLGSGNWFCVSYLRAASTINLLSVDTDTTLAANSDTRIATQKAVKTYVDTATASAGKPAFKNLLIGGSALTNPWQRGTSVAASGGTAQVSQGAGTVLGNMTSGGGLAAAFDGTTSQTDAASAKSASKPAYVGKDWGAGNTKIVARVDLYAPSDVSFDRGGGSNSCTITIQGSTDNFSASVVDLYTETFSATPAQVKSITSGITQTTAYRYHRVKFDSIDGAVVNHAVAEVLFYEATSPAAYTADMWKAWGANSSSALTVSQQDSGVTASPKCFRLQRTASNTDTGVLGVAQVIETINAKSLQGQSVTLSFKARAGANFSAASSYLVSTISTGTGSDQGSTSLIAGTWTGQANTTQNNTLTTSFQTFTQTITVPSGATEAAVRLSYTPVGTAGAADYFEIMDVQLEVGSSASTFEALPVDVVRARCRRYYQANTFTTGNPVGVGQCTSTGNAVVTVSVGGEMRAAPTVTLSSTSDFQLSQSTYVLGTCTAGSTIGSTKYGVYTFSMNAPSLPGAGYATIFVPANGNATIYATAEL